ncbi:MAG TPA: alpha-amylase family glycosyl hydrolase [Anaerolineae bacterium]|nr:alpha-amylase family glycosyl hydrolase [Anaerolineae bacterium]
MQNLPLWLQSLHHDGSPLYVTPTQPTYTTPLTIRIRHHPSAPIHALYLRTCPNGEKLIQPLHKTTHDSVTQWWHITLTPQTPTLHYRFIVDTDDGLWHYNALGPHQHIPPDHYDFRLLINHQAPTWLDHITFYQIFPDRFANGDPTLNPGPHSSHYPGHTPITFPWGQPPDPNCPFPARYYGGDLPGLISKLDYLQDLGINAIYLNPIFTAPSNHKYDGIDYDNVDPTLGGNQALINLRHALDQRDMRYLLDIVPNHCGQLHPWFTTAQADPHAPEADFFTFYNHPDQYHMWLGVPTLPKLNYTSPLLRQKMYQAPNAILRRWLLPPYRADGWRFDVANMLGRQNQIQIRDEISRQMRQAIKQSAPDAYLVGENFFDATPQLQGDQWDAIMNYSGFTLPLRHWLTGYQEFWNDGEWHHIGRGQPWPTHAFVTTYQQHHAAIPWLITHHQFNQISSHDIPRLRQQVDDNDALHRLAAGLQFTLPGVPCLYYGEEIGLMDDPHLNSRNCMPWDDHANWNHDLFAFYQTLIQLRRQSLLFSQGSLQFLAIEPHTLIYQRQTQTERLLVIAHRHQTPRPAQPLPITHAAIPNHTTFTELFTHRTITATDDHLPLPSLPQGITFWHTNSSLPRHT